MAFDRLLLAPEPAGQRLPKAQVIALQVVSSAEDGWARQYRAGGVGVRRRTNEATDPVAL